MVSSFNNTALRDGCLRAHRPSLQNRFWLTPQLAFSSANERRITALRQLTRNSVIEIALGLTIFAIVGALGTLHPAFHFMN